MSDDLLISGQQIGRARLGMPFGELKRLFPGATFHIVTVRPDETSDIAVRLDGRDRLFIRTREMDETTVDELPSADDPVRSLMTGDERYSTSKGVRPRSDFAEAVKAYGKPELFYQPPTEFAAFKTPDVGNITFHLAGPTPTQPAGVYQMKGEGMEDGWHKSDRAQPGSKIIFIAVVEM